MSDYHREPLLCGKKALLAYVLGILTIELLRMASAGTGESRQELTRAAFWLGHMILAACVIRKGQLSVAFPISRDWIDWFTVAGAPFVGAIFWYWEWKKAPVKQRVVTLQQEISPIAKHHIIWIVVAISVIWVAIEYWRTQIIGSL